MSEEEVASVEDSALLLGSKPPRGDIRHTELGQLLRQHNGELVNYVYSWVHSRADAADIVQEAYIRFFRLGDRNAVSHLRAFLFKVARNVATDFIRKRIVREAFAEEEPLRASGEAPSTEHIWVAKEELEVLQRAIETLPPRTRMALMLVREDGLSYEELGARLGIKTHSARRLVERAMEYLLEAVSERSINPGGK
jgi:RNA polymerase sigma-70 factor (ECF subfamily)